MKLYLIHTGYYDKNNGDGFYEQHSNIFIVAESVYAAREKVKKTKEYMDLKCILMELKKLKISMVIKLI